jgi:hypothetical protein
VRVAGHWHWDVLRLFDEIQNGLALAAKQCGEIASVGVDTWGVDFGLLDQDGTLIGNPYHYRDHRTDGMMERVFERVPRAEIFDTTGIQFMQLNTLYQLAAVQGTPALDIAYTLLLMPDLLNYWLTGEKLGEFTIATTTQFYDSRRRTWATDLLTKLGLPTHILPRVISPATKIGALLASLAEQPGLHHTQVIAPACHDTGSAVATVPAHSEHYAYISSGTWSLMGTVVPEPMITQPGAQSRRPETASVAQVLQKYRDLVSIQPPGTLDGGDVLRIDKTLYDGSSSRSNGSGIEQLALATAPFGYRVVPVPVGECLHLKSAVTQVGPNHLLINRRLVDQGFFPGMDFIDVADDEPMGANALLVGNQVIYSGAFPRTRGRLEEKGLAVRCLDVSEVEKAEGAVTCCSLIFEASPIQTGRVS